MDDSAETLRHRLERASRALGFARVVGDPGAIEAATAALAGLIAQADEQGIGPGPSHESGIDVACDEAFEARPEEFNARPFDERTALLHPPVREDPEQATAEFVHDESAIAAVHPGRADTYRAIRENRGRKRSYGHPAVRLEPRAVLAEAAAPTVTMRRLAFIGRWCGPGRVVDKHGEPFGTELADLCAQLDIDAPQSAKIRTLRDVPQLGELWRLAVRADVVRTRCGRAAPGPRAQAAEAVTAGEAQDETALELWLETFQAAVDVEDLDAQPAQQADPAVRAVLAALYDAGGPITLADVERVLEGVVPDWTEQDGFPAVLLAQIRQSAEMFRRLLHCGAISISPANGPGATDGRAAAARRPEEIAATLTPLGVYGARAYLLGTGCDAPVTTG